MCSREPELRHLEMRTRNMKSRSYQFGACVLGLLAFAACSAPMDEVAQSEQAITCSDAPQWAAGIAYPVGAEVKNLGHRYACKVTGWCMQGGPYEPGRGWAAGDAWQALGACDAGTGGAGGGAGAGGS